MDRPFVYPGEIPRTADILGGFKSALYGVGHMARAAFGSATCVSGLQIAASGPPSLTVSIGLGSIYTEQQVDASAYGTLGLDTNSLVKQGILPAPTTLTITPPGTAGYSQIYLVEAIYNNQDTGAATLPYYNSANPAVPLSGPANSGAAQYTNRQGVCVISLKAGTAGPTGSQAAPTPDAGYVGLWLITVANGQTTITSANWTIYPGAPFIPNLMSLDGRYQRITPSLTFYVDASIGNDANPGTSPSLPFLTGQGAVDAISVNYASSGIVTVNFAHGTYNGFTVNSSFIANWNFVGDSGSPNSVVLLAVSSGINGGNSVKANNCSLSLTGFAFSSFNFNVNCSVSNLVMTNCNLEGSANSYCIGLFNNSTGLIYGSIGVSGGGVGFLTSNNGSQTSMGNAAGPTLTLTFTIAGTFAISAAGFTAFDGGITFSPGVITLSGTATGVRYIANANGVINTQGSGGTYLPGNAAGSTANGGQYL